MHNRLSRPFFDFLLITYILSRLVTRNEAASWKEEARGRQYMADDLDPRGLYDHGAKRLG